MSWCVKVKRLSSIVLSIGIGQLTANERLFSSGAWRIHFALFVPSVRRRKIRQSLRCLISVKSTETLRTEPICYESNHRILFWSVGRLSFSSCQQIRRSETNDTLLRRSSWPASLTDTLTLKPLSIEDKRLMNNKSRNADLHQWPMTHTHTNWTTDKSSAKRRNSSFDWTDQWGTADLELGDVDCLIPRPIQLSRRKKSHSKCSTRIDKMATMKLCCERWKSHCQKRFFQTAIFIRVLLSKELWERQTDRHVCLALVTSRFLPMA